MTKSAPYVEIYPMLAVQDGATLGVHKDTGEAAFYDIVVRQDYPDTGNIEILEERENIVSYEQAHEIAQQLAAKYNTDIIEDIPAD